MLGQTETCGMTWQVGAKAKVLSWTAKPVSFWANKSINRIHSDIVTVRSLKIFEQHRPKSQTFTGVQDEVYGGGAVLAIPVCKKRWVLCSSISFHGILCENLLKFWDCLYVYILYYSGDGNCQQVCRAVEVNALAAIQWSEIDLSKERRTLWHGGVCPPII